MQIEDLKISCSDIVDIMGTSYKGLTENQKEEIATLQSKSRTAKQQEKLDFLINKRDYMPDLDLSVGCKTLLIDLYCQHYKGKKKSGFIGSKPEMMKGVMSEIDALNMVARNTGECYAVDKRTLSNDFLIGKLDAFIGECLENAEKVVDIKCNWDMSQFYESIRDELTVDYDWQMQGYMGMTGAKSAEVIFALMNTPDELLQEEFRKVRRRMAAAWDDPAYLEEIDKIRIYHTYDEMPEHERFCIFTVQRNEEKIQSIYKKVAECRKWLLSFHQIVTERTFKPMFTS